MQTRAAKLLARKNNETLKCIIGRLKSAGIATHTHPPVARKLAAVLVPLFEGPDGVVRVLLTRRTSSLSSHAGEVALPGGKRDETDVDDVHTALREANEELGLHDVEILGILRPVLSKHLLSVTPVIARISGADSLKPNPEEVDAVFTVPLQIFLENNPEIYSFKDATQGVDVRFRLHFFRYCGFTIWGLTAGILIEVASVALGRDPCFQTTPQGGGKYSDIIYDGNSIVLQPQK